MLNLSSFSQSEVTEYRGIYYYEYYPPNSLVALEPETGCWWELPPMPEFKAGLPEICEMVASGSNLVVMGGRDRDSQEYLDSVFVFDFLWYKWRRGANTPGGQRWFFDTSSRQWLMLDSGYHDDMIIKSPKYFVKGTDQKLYTLSDSDLVVLEDGKWKLVARLPADVATRPYITPFPGNLLYTCKPYYYPHDAYILDLKHLIWTILEVPTEYSDHVVSSCCFTI